jgi:hypothetical protein
LARALEAAEIEVAAQRANMAAASTANRVNMR